MTARPRSGAPLAAVAALACGISLAAQAPFPPQPPKPGTPKDFQVPAPKRFTLDNGLQVAMVQWGNMPKVRVSLTVRTGKAFEKANEVWLADLTGSLMREGTATRSATAISEEAARMGGSLAVGAGADTTGVGGEVLSEFGPRFVELVADVVRNPAFPESELPRLKSNLARELAVALSQPQQVALQKFRQVLYGDHAYGRVFPTNEMIQGYTVEQVRQFYRATFGAGHSHLYVVGQFDPAAMEAAVRKAFAGWSKGTLPAAAAPKPASTRVIHLIDRPGAPQSTILLGFPTIEPTSDDYVALTVMDALLGGAFASRITRNIREEKGYTYSPYSEVSVRYRDAYWAQNADVTTEHTGASLKEIFAEIDRLQATPPDPKELSGIQNYLAGTWVLQNSSRGGILSQLRYVDLHGLPADYPNTYVKKVFAVTPQQVSEIARKYVKDEQATIVIVGDRKVIEEQVKPFGRIADQ
ncbi:MAG TPA: pitrilysin family protein [Vicinamibacterales bacterium]|nr:pitrilysin family protein [Vicinamibacterales bacterium]